MQQAGALDCLTGLSSSGSTMANAQPPLQGLLPSFFTSSCEQTCAASLSGLTPTNHVELAETASSSIDNSDSGTLVSRSTVAMRAQRLLPELRLRCVRHIA